MAIGFWLAMAPYATTSEGVYRENLELAYTLSFIALGVYATMMVAVAAG